MASRVVDWLEEGIVRANSDEAFAFFYCKRSDESRRDPVQILRSIVRQLAAPRTWQGRNEIHEAVDTRYNVGRDTGTDLNFNACREVLKKFVETYPQTTIVLDALDECDRDCPYELMSLFDVLLAQASRPVKLFIASRPDGDIREHFSGRSIIDVRATENHNDICKYIHAEVQKHPRWSKLHQALRKEIGSILIEKSDGM